MSAESSSTTESTSSESSTSRESTSSEPNSTDTAAGRPGESATATANTLTMTRIFDAPRELVFAAWTDPDQLAQWWGPDQLHTPRGSVRVEPRLGGVWQATMVMDDGGQEFPTSATFTRFDPPNGFELHDGPTEFFAFDTDLTVTFEDVDGGTRMTILQNFHTPSFDFGDSILGWGTSLEKLRRQLAGPQAA